MSFKNDGPKLAARAASAISQYVPVMLLPGGSALSETVRNARLSEPPAAGETVPGLDDGPNPGK